ncbi:MAG: ATP synthase F0 subunit B [Clostridiales bacterium]|nr:ATP synthase F0 subunit B [Clostridiales bacterium]
MIEQSVEEYLNKLESQITLAKKSFMSDLKLVDEGACLECIAAIRNLLPSELSEARLIRKDAQNIIANANKQAQQIVDNASAQAQQMVAENKIVEDAKAEADRILQQASEYANNMVGQAYNDLARLYDEAESHSREIVDVIMQAKAKVFPQYPNQQQQD